MRKIFFLAVLVLLIGSTYSQTREPDTLSNKIEEIKKVFRVVGLDKLDKIEGIYLFNRKRVMSGWEGEATKLFNGTTTKNVYGFVIRSLSVENRFDIYEYLESQNYFAENANKWFIKKDGTKYVTTCCFDSSGKSFDHFENEVAFSGNKISFDLNSKFKLGGGESNYTYNSIQKIYPSSLEDNIFKTGTAFFLSKNGYIVTNYHVVKEATNVYVSNEIYHRLKAEVLFVDELNDIAILKINISLKDLPYNILSTSKEIGNNVFTLGFPYVQSMGKEVKLTNGIINSNSGFENDPRYYQFSAEIQPGNSGGPLFDSEGNIIGLVSAKHTQATNAGYALKTKFLIDFIKLNDPSILKQNVNSVKNLSLALKYKALKNYILLLEME